MASITSSGATQLVFLVVLLLLLAARAEPQKDKKDNADNSYKKEDNTNNKWRWSPESSHPCTITRYTLDEIYAIFGPEGVPALYETPLVILASSTSKNKNALLQQVSHRDTILSQFPPGFNVTLSSSNSFSQHRRIVTLQTYVEEIMTQNNGRTLPHQRSNESWYLFGETFTEEWKQQITRHYLLPPGQTCLPDYVALSFGIGNQGSGVQWHIHGPGFSEAIHGRKHWVLYPPYYNPPYFHHDQSTRNWMEYIYTNDTLLQDYRDEFMANSDNFGNDNNNKHPILPNGRPYECTLEPGDLIYFPDRWHHATLNCDKYTAFISTFTSDHLFLQDQKTKRKKASHNDNVFFNAGEEL